MSQTKAQLLDNIKDNVQLDARNSLRFADTDSSHYVAFKAPATVSSNVTWTLPAADGSANYVLATDGSGTLSWIADPAGQWTTSGSNIYFTGGNVGIGDTSPSNPLSVTGASAFNGDVTFTGASYNATWDKSTDHLIFDDNAKAVFGAGSDLKIFHSGSYSFIQDSGTGGLVINTDALYVKNAADNEAIAYFTENGAVDLYYDNVKKLNTESWGVTIQDDLKIIGAEGNHAQIRLVADEGDDNNDNWRLRAEDNGSIFLQNYADAAWETNLKGIGGGAIELYHNNALQCYTFDTGLKFNDDKQVRLGTDDDMRMYHDNSQGIINNSTGILKIRSGELHLAKTDNEIYLKGVADGAVELYHDNGKRLSTISNGILVTGGEGTAGEIQLSADEGDDNSDKWDIRVTSGGLFKIQNYASGSWEDNIVSNANGAIELYHDNAKVVETKADGLKVKRPSGGATYLEIHGCEGQDAVLYLAADEADDNNDQMRLVAGQGSYSLQNYGGGSWETNASFHADAQVELYYNGTKKLATAASGVDLANNGTLSNNGINFERGTGTGDYSTKFGVTNYPDASGYGDEDDGYWCKIESKGGTVVILNTDGTHDSGRNNYDHFSIYQKANTEVSNAGRRLFSVDNIGQVQFGRAGIMIDNSWAGQPSITVQRNNNDGTDNTNDGAYMRVHGIGNTHQSWTGGAGGNDFSANFLIDGDTYGTSDRRGKTDIVDCPYGLAVVNKLQPRKYQLVNSELEPQGDDNINLGFIAQEIKEHIPECVNYLGDASDIPNEKGWARAYALSMNEVVPVLTKAIQELSTQVETLETKVAALESA